MKKTNIKRAKMLHTEEHDIVGEWVLNTDEKGVKTYLIVVGEQDHVYELPIELGELLINKTDSTTNLESIDTFRDQLALLYLSKLPTIPPVHEHTNEIVDEFFKDAYLFADAGLKTRNHGN